MGWIRVTKLGLVSVGDALYGEGCKYLLLQKLHQRFTADLLDNQSGNDIIRIAVLPLRSGVKIERLACQLSRIFTRNMKTSSDKRCNVA